MNSASPVDSGSETYRRLLSYVWPHRWIFLIAVVGMVGASGAEMSLAAFLKPIMDEGFVKRDEAFIEWIPIILILVFLIRGACGFFATYCMQWVGRRVVYDLRSKMYERLITLPTSFFDLNSSAALVSKLIYDVEQVADASTNSLTTLIKDSVLAIGLLSWMIYIDWQLTLIFILLAPMIGVVVKIASRRFRIVSKNIQLSIGRIAHVAKESLQGHRIVKLNGGHRREQTAFAEVNNANRQQAMKRATVAAANEPIIIGVVGSGFAAIIYFATKQSGSDAITPGDFVSYLGTMMMLLAPMKRLAKINEIIQVGLAAAQSAFNIIDEIPEMDRAHRNVGVLKGNIEFRNVSFAYQGSSELVLDGINMRIKAGQTLALVGPSGGGKSTVASLLVRFYQPTSGEILVDGQGIETMSLASLRKNVAMVTQETLLFDDTIENNIIYGHEGPIDEMRLQDAIRAAYVNEIIDKLPDGLETVIGEQGSNLSGGQRQRVAIARAIYKNTPILVFDEATSSLDTESERYVQKAIENLLNNRTTIVIAHRLSTIESADVIAVFNKGKIVESGDHASLLKNKGLYDRLYYSQFDKDVVVN